MLEAAGKAKVKGSGCIRTREHFLKLIDMGVDRMGIGYRSTPVVLGLENKPFSCSGYAAFSTAAYPENARTPFARPYFRNMRCFSGSRNHSENS